MNRNLTPASPYTDLAAAQKALRSVGHEAQAREMTKRAHAATTVAEMEEIISAYVDRAAQAQHEQMSRLVADMLSRRPTS